MKYIKKFELFGWGKKKKTVKDTIRGIDNISADVKEKMKRSIMSLSKAGRHTINLANYINTPFTEDDTNRIKDFFIEMEDKYNLEEDPNGEIIDYMQMGYPHRRGRDKVQYFIENKGKLLIFTIASSQDFITDELILDLKKFKNRLEKLGYKCDKNDTLFRPWIKYISFYINRNIDNLGSISQEFFK